MRKGRRFFKALGISLIFFCAVIGINYRLDKASAAQFGEEKPSILVIGRGGRRSLMIDKRYREQLEEDGYVVVAAAGGDVSWDILRQFNVVVLAGSGLNKELLGRFMEQGGGVLELRSWGHQRSFSRSLGIRVLREGIVEKDKDKVHSYRAFHPQLIFGLTTNIVEGHPVTEGVKNLWYPIEWFYDESTAALRQDDDSWQILIKGSETAYSSPTYRFDDTQRMGKHVIPHPMGSYKSEPPILAVREYRNGRIVLFASNFSFWMTSVYHRWWENGYVMKNGDGYKLLDNIYRWLAQPSLKKGTLGGWSGAKILGPPETVSTSTSRYLGPHEQEPQGRPYGGVIGIHSAYSDGKGTVREYCDIAKEKGYDFIVFTEVVKLMSKEKWDALAKDCARESTETFLAIPGIRFGSFVCFNLYGWPSDRRLSPEIPYAAINNEGELTDIGQIYFVQDWPNMVFVAPGLSSFPPGAARFHQCLAVFSYEKGKLVDSAVDYYLSRQADQFNYQPMSIVSIYSPEELQGLPEDVYLTYDLAPSLEKLLYQMKRNANKWGIKESRLKTTFVSNGPLINRFYLEGKRRLVDLWQEWYSWSRGEEARIHIDVYSDSPVKQVSLYRRKEIIRQFRPNAKRFVTTVTEIMRQDGPYVLVVEDARGRQAISSSIVTMNNYYGRVNINYGTNKCADLQGIIGGGISGLSYWHARIIPMVRQEDIVPYTFDMDMAKIEISTRPEFSAEGERERIGPPRRDIVFSSEDVDIIDNHYLTRPGFRCPRDVKTVVRYTHFRSRPNSYNMILVDCRTEFKKDLYLKDSRVSLVRLGGGFRRYAYLGADGLLHEGGTKIITTGLATRGFVAKFPGVWGSPAIYAVRDIPYYLDLTPGSLGLGRKVVGKFIRGGTVWRDRFLVVLNNGAPVGSREFRHLWDIYGFDGKPSYTVNLGHGRVVDTVYALTLETQDYYVSGKISNAALPNDLPVIVTGLNPNWDAGAYDKETGRLERIGVFEGMGFYALDIRRTRNVFIGNLLTCDRPEIKLFLLRMGSNGTQFEVHNPTATRIAVTVKGASQIPALSKIEKSCTVGAGESKIVFISEEP